MSEFDVSPGLARTGPDLPPVTDGFDLASTAILILWFLSPLLLIIGPLIAGLAIEAIARSLKTTPGKRRPLPLPTLGEARPPRLATAGRRKFSRKSYTGRTIAALDRARRSFGIRDRRRDKAGRRNASMDNRSETGDHRRPRCIEPKDPDVEDQAGAKVAIAPLHRCARVQS